MLILAILISAVLSYLLGSFNSSILVVRLLKHQDIREFGSHNAGLTNTLRCFGKGCAALTLVGDLAKGIVAVLLSKGICELLGTGLTAQNDVHFIGYISGIFAIRSGSQESSNTARSSTIICRPARLYSCIRQSLS